MPHLSTRFQSGFVQLIGFGLADAATWRFAGSNAGLLVAAGHLLQWLGGLLSRHDEAPE